MPMSRAVARRVSASGPASTSRVRAVARISARVASRWRARRVVVGTSRSSGPGDRAGTRVLTGGERCKHSEQRSLYSVHSGKRHSDQAHGKGATMFDRLGHTVYRGRRWVLATATAVLVLGATWGTGVFGAMTSSGFDDPGSESAAA